MVRVKGRFFVAGFVWYVTIEPRIRTVNMIVILDNLRSSHNVGSLFRTADALGIEKVYLCGTTPAPVDKWGRQNSRLAKVSLGAEKSVAWEQCASTARLLSHLKKEGYEIVAVEQAEGSLSLEKARFSKKRLTKIALVFGGEVAGLSKAALNRADVVIEIPMLGAKESLNVSVAFGIAGFWLSHASS